MPRVYSTRLIALTIGLSAKWLDNLLSHFDLPGVPKGRQGVQRDITDEGLLTIELTRSLVRELGVSLESAADLARRAIQSRSPTEARISTESGVTLVFHLAMIEKRLHEQMVQAVESVAKIRRGRPRNVGVPDSSG